MPLAGSIEAANATCTKCGSLGPFRIDGKYQRTTCMKCDSRTNSIRNKINKYGVDGREFVGMVLSQNGKCALCDGDPNEKGLVIDHDHASGAVRELLCDRCNRVLGFVGDDPALLRAAADYVEKHRAL